MLFTEYQDLPASHVCRGLYTVSKSPFVQVASTERVKRGTFFHAVAANDTQTLFLSKFKTPRRRTAATPRAVEDSGVPDRTEPTGQEFGGTEEREFAAKVLARLEAMQTELTSRFDNVDQQLRRLDERLDRLEQRRR